jgi:prepilin peptidase CpaA
MPGAATWWTDAACLLVCVAAARTDLRERRIPNALTFSAFGLALVLAFATEAAERGFAAGLARGLAPAFGGAALLFGSFLGIALLGAVGMGDVKLMGAVGAFLGWPTAYRALVDVLLAGALVAIARGLARRELGAAFANIARAARRPFERDEATRAVELHPMPYAVAILIGTTWAIVGRYLPFLRFP